MNHTWLIGNQYKEGETSLALRRDSRHALMLKQSLPSPLLLGCDLASVAVALVVCSWPALASAGMDTATLGRIALYACTWIVLAQRLGTYLVPFHGSSLAVVRAAAEAWIITAGIAGLADVILLGTPAATVWRVAGSGLLLLLIARVTQLRCYIGKASYRRPRVLLIGSGSQAASLAADQDRTDDRNRGLDLSGYVPFPDEPIRALPQLRCLGQLDRLQEVLIEHRIDLALVCPAEQASSRDIDEVFRVCDRTRLSARLLPPALNLEHLHASLAGFDGRLELEFQSLPDRSLTMVAKRLVDVVGASIGILLLLPAFIACAFAVRLTSQGPILYPQIRVGRHGRLFRCLKFRTMRTGAHQLQAKLRQNSIQDGPAFKIPNDPRITPVGAWLRRYSLDELPQMFNVLFGDMSLVGPRPPIPAEVDRYAWWQRRRISVVPGLTCVWQVWGRNQVSFKRWVEMDLYYIDNWSLWLDIKLSAHTVRTVVRGTGM